MKEREKQEIKTNFWKEKETIIGFAEIIEIMLKKNETIKESTVIRNTIDKFQSKFKMLNNSDQIY